MEVKTKILDKIKSKAMLEVIFSFISSKSYKLLFFKYAKKFQQKLGIKLNDYKIAHIVNKRSINLMKYLSFKNNFEKEEDKSILRNELESDLNDLKLDIDLKHFEECAFDYFKEENIDENEIYLDIYSPFYGYLVERGFKNKAIELVIPVDRIKSFQLKNDYIFALQTLNNSIINTNNLWINFIYNDYDDMNYLIDLKFNFKLLKRLDLIQEKERKNNDDEKEKNKEALCDNLYNVIFSLPDIQNNLIGLYLKSPSSYESTEINLEGINNLKALKSLFISNYSFKTPFVLKLFSLKTLQLIRVKNIALDENTSNNIVGFYINDSEINKLNELLNFPNLENMRFFSCSISEYINFKNLKKLNLMYTEASLLSKIKDEDISVLTSLKEIYIFNAIYNNNEMIKKLLLIPNIEKALISGLINSEDLKKVQGKNLSLKKLIVKYAQKECYLNDFQNLFPNVNEIVIDSHKTPMEVHPWCGTCQIEQHGKHYKSNIIIEENKECITDKIKIIGGGCKVMSLCCNSFENLKEFTVDIENMINCCTIPIFDSKNKIIFKSLNTFCFRISRRSKDIFSGKVLKIISDNVDKMPNLRTFKLSCCLCKLDENLYLDLIKKLLIRNLDEIFLLIRVGCFNSADYFLGFTNDQNRYDYNDYNRYSKKELLDMCQDKNVIIKDYRKIAIYKLNKLNIFD